MIPKSAVRLVSKSALRRSPAPSRSTARGRNQGRDTNSYLSPKCEVRRVVEKGGFAVYAAEAISKGELLVVWSGTLVDGEALSRLPANFRRHSLQVDEDHFLVSLTDSEPADYVNHSCNPNAGLRGQIALVAMRDIELGEEITYDYAMSDGSDYDEFECKCGAPQCRHWVGSRDWQLSELWDRYEGYYSPYLASRIAALVKEQRAAPQVVRNSAFSEITEHAAP